MTHLYMITHALRQLHVFPTSSDWFTGLSVSFVIGQSDYFGLILQHSIENNTMSYQFSNNNNKNYIYLQVNTNIQKIYI